MSYGPWTDPCRQCHPYFLKPSLKYMPSYSKGREITLKLFKKSRVVNLDEMDIGLKDLSLLRVNIHDTLGSTSTIHKLNVSPTVPLSFVLLTTFALVRLASIPLG